MLKTYLINGKQWLYEEGTQPDGAVELKAEKPEDKAAPPAKNKGRKAATK